MQRLMTTGNRPWPTLADRLSQPRTSRAEAVSQLQTTMPLNRDDAIGAQDFLPAQASAQPRGRLGRARDPITDRQKR